MRTVVLEVDEVALFERLADSPNLADALGNRLVGALLAKTSFREDIGLAVYGITVKEDKST